MSLRVSNVRLPVAEPETALGTHLARFLGVRPSDLSSWRILRKSLDARDKGRLQYVYSAEVTLPDGEGRLLARLKNRARSAQVEVYREPPFEMPAPGDAPLRERPVVVGSGPGGLMAGYFLAEQGYRPIVLERGTAVPERIRDVKRFDAGGSFEPESNYLFGEGGAGTFSDGKLTCRLSGPDVRRVLEVFATHKGKPSVLYDHRPHLGSNRLPAVVKALRRKIEEFGGEVRFRAKVDDFLVDGGRVRGVVVNGETLPASVVVLAVGHSARDTFEVLLRRGVTLERKAFQMGVRVEHPQDLVNRVQYGSVRLEDKLGSADYSLVARGSNDVFTFCMCAGGHVIPSVSREGYFCTNGMSLSGRDSPYANSGLVVTVPPEAFGGDDPLAGVRLQEHYERRAFEIGGPEYRCPAQLATDFLAGRVSQGVLRSSYPRGTVNADLSELLPPMVTEALRQGLPEMDRFWRGRFLPEAVLVAPESRGSSPVRMARDEQTRESPGVAGLYPVGEGAGYAGGIVSAAVDGLRTAKAVVARYAPGR